MTESPTSTLGSTTFGQLAPIRVVVVDGPDQGKDFTLDRGTLTVGSQEGVDLRLTDGSVSRKHLAIELLGARVRVKDLGSKNGTRFLGNRVDAIELPVGVSLEVGQTRLAIVPAVGHGALFGKDDFYGLVGRSVRMRRLFAQLEQVALTDAAVLLVGQTGTGKEAVARALHQASGRASGPLVIFDCGSVAPTLMQSALFGHVKGAFTGAVKDAAGALEQAEGGILFLDEVSQLPLELQPLLLRALESKTYTRVGEGKARSSDFRVVASTQFDLSELAQQNRFRTDLYYRLAALVLEVPALADRSDDVPLLAHRFAAESGAKEPLAPSTLSTLAATTFKGNVRELKNMVERIVAFGPQAVFPSTPSASLDFHQSREQALRAFEKGYLEALLQRHQGNASAAARDAGIARSYLYRLLETHDLKR
jgi:DNA-binding NtrC family response regulator